MVDQRNPKKLDDRNSQDRFTYLPNHLIVIILSLLTSKEAVRTSILSRAWRYIWTSISKIVVDDTFPVNFPKELERHPNRKLNFLKSVDNLMLLHNECNIESFHLILNNYDVEQFRIDPWICSAIGHRVRKLDVSLTSLSRYVFYSPFFSFRTLTTLRLNECVLRIIMPCCFPNLKKCRLSEVTFAYGGYAHCLFPTSPSLVDLVLKDCHWENSETRTFIIVIPSLKRFKMIFDDVQQCIKLFAPNLEDLKLWGGDLSNDIILYKCCSLVKVSLSFFMWGSPCLTRVYRALRIIESIRTMRSLKIQDWLLRDFRYVQDLSLVEYLPTSNLSHLKIVYCDPFDCGVDLMGILLRSPNIKTLYIDVCPTSGSFELNEEWMAYWPPYNFTTTSLERVTVHGFKGNRAEMHLLEILLTHAGRLEELNLTYFTSLLNNRNKFNKVINRLTGVMPRASHCVINLEKMPEVHPDP